MPNVFNIIKYQFTNDTFVAKFEGTDFTTLSRLYVNESQQAVLYKDGKAVDVFTNPGEYTLHTKNIPGLRKLVNLPFDGESPFKCEVYFVNMTEQGINWGVSDLNYCDPNFKGYSFKIGAHGTMNLRVKDSMKLITTLVGTEDSFTHETFEQKVRDILVPHIKTNLLEHLEKNSVSIYKVDNELVDLASEMIAPISKLLDDYGIELKRFVISGILKPVNDSFYQEHNSLIGEAITTDQKGEIEKSKTVFEAERSKIKHDEKIAEDKDEIDLKAYMYKRFGISYTTEKAIEALQELAKNQGVANVRNDIMGLGIGVGVGGKLSDSFANLLDRVLPVDTSASSIPEVVPQKPAMFEIEEEIVAPMPVAPASGIVEIKEDISAPADVKTDSVNASTSEDDLRAALAEVDLLRDSGIITEDECKSQRAEIISRHFRSKY